MYTVLLNSYLIVFFCVLLWCPYIVINVSIQYNGGFLSEMILLTLYDKIGKRLLIAQKV